VADGTFPRDEYRRRLARWIASNQILEQRHALFANLRLAVFAGAAVVAWLAFARHALSPAWLLGFVVGFGALAVSHAKVLNTLERGTRARRLYETALERLDGRWMGTGPDGARFLDGHPFARDLDLLGPASLFQLLDTAKTEAGQETLAAWIGEPAALDEVCARQAAIDELRPRLDLREDLAILGAEAHIGRTGPLTAWSASPAAALTSGSAWAFATSAAASVAMVALGLTERINFGWTVFWLLIQWALVARYRRQVDAVASAVNTPSQDLRLLQELLERLEREPFATPRLAAIHAALVASGAPPSLRIKRLRTFISLLESEHNPYFQLTGLAFILLIKQQATAAIDRWHAQHGGVLAGWLCAIGELEALTALATYAYEHPDDPFPELSGSDSGPVLEADALGHPLIHESVVVRNDVRLGRAHPHVLIVSGSNMSGKSTLLRAVGVNVVLAQAGAPVRAARLRLSPLAIGATLRVEDSLAEHRSRFYAEILKIREVVDVSRGPRPLLFLLDEILHGTNSHDRRIGAEAIVRALVSAGAIGLVTTHDLALTALATDLGAPAANVHFEDRLEEGRMVFDYRMRSGVVERSNALALMRAVGLDV
jgi:hypothetical protein